MKVVGAALGHQPNLRPAGIAGVGIGVGGGNAEFLDRVGWHGQDAGKREAVVLVVDADVVEGDVRLVAARAVHRAAAGISGRLLHLQSEVRYPWLQTKQLHHVAVGDGQFGDLRFVDGVAE